MRRAVGSVTSPTQQVIPNKISKMLGYAQCYRFLFKRILKLIVELSFMVGLPSKLKLV